MTENLPIDYRKQGEDRLRTMFDSLSDPMKERLASYVDEWRKKVDESKKSDTISS